MMTKQILTRITGMVAAVVVATVSMACADEKDHKHHDHDHGKAEAGPNGGRVLHEVEPHLEFFVTKDRKVKITALDDKLKAIPIANQVVTLVGGDRKAPIRLKFVKEGTTLISTTAFPEGDDFPVVVQIKKKPLKKAVTEKFTLDLSPCPTCKFLEYACTCDHGHDHNHEKKGKK
jgi:hypothetical protein